MPFRASMDMPITIYLLSHRKQEKIPSLDIYTVAPQKLGIHPGMVKNKTINQGKGNRVASVLYLCDSILLNCLGKLYVKVELRVLVFYV